MSEVLALDSPYAVRYSLDAPLARSLIDPSGTLLENGLAFQDFVATHVSIAGR